MGHRRSIKSLARRYILKRAYHDQELAEVVSRNSKEQVEAFLSLHFETEKELQRALVNVPSTEFGLVLSDSRGRGAFQYE